MVVADDNGASHILYGSDKYFSGMGNSFVYQTDTGNGNRNRFMNTVKRDDYKMLFFRFPIRLDQIIDITRSFNSTRIISSPFRDDLKLHYSFLLF